MQVGKTSMIKSLIDDEGYQDRPQTSQESLLKPVFLRGDTFYHNKDVILIDTSSRHDKQEETVREIVKSHLIILVYDMNAPGSVDALTRTWLPLVSANNRVVPIILIGNKLDLVIDDEDKYVRSRVKRVLGLVFKDFKVG